MEKASSRTSSVKLCELLPVIPLTNIQCHINLYFTLIYTRNASPPILEFKPYYTCYIYSFCRILNNCVS